MGLGWSGTGALKFGEYSVISECWQGLVALIAMCGSDRYNGFI